MRGIAIDISRSRNSHMRAPRSVTATPIGMPSRILKLAMDLRARRMFGFWPAIVPSCSAALSSSLVSTLASPTPNVQRDLLDPGRLHHTRVAEALLKLRPDLVQVARLQAWSDLGLCDGHG